MRSPGAGPAPEDLAWEREWESLHREHAARLTRLARLLLRDPEEARDVVQEVFGRVATARRAIEPPRDWRAWLTRVTVNACHSRARAGWWPRFRRQSQALEAGALTDPGAPPDVAAAGREARDRVWRAFLALPLRQREVLVLRQLEEWSTAEAAGALGLSEGAVKTHLFRAVRKLRAALGEAP